MKRTSTRSIVAVSSALFALLGLSCAAISSTTKGESSVAATPAEPELDVAASGPSEAPSSDGQPPRAIPAPTPLAEHVGSADETPKVAETFTMPSGLVASSELAQSPKALPEGTTVLHVGDSFAGALGIELNKLFKAHGIRGVLKYQTSSYIPTWASGRELPQYLANYRPDLVLVTLGANEMEIDEPEQRASRVRKLVARIGDRPCVWIAPSLWGQDNGLLEVIRSNLGHCRYMDTNALVRSMPRAGDKIHPSMEARPDWATIVLRWLALQRKQDGARPWELD